MFGDKYNKAKEADDDLKIRNHLNYIATKKDQDCVPSWEKKYWASQHQSYSNLAKLKGNDKLEARQLQGLTASFKELRVIDKDPNGAYVDKPVSKTRGELMALRNRRDHEKIADTTAKGIATSLEARRI